MTAGERVHTLALYLLAFLYVSAHRARWLWAIFFLFCILTPLIAAQHPYLAGLILVGALGCIVAVTLPNRMIYLIPPAQVEDREPGGVEQS